MRDNLRKHAMHAAAAIALIGCLAGLVRGVMGLVKVINDAPEAKPLAVVETFLMAAILAGLVVLCVKSFIDARRRRRQGQPVST
jgi:hypothetical protein